MLQASLPRHLVAYDPHADRLLAHGGKGSSDELLVHVGLQLWDKHFQMLDQAEAERAQRFTLPHPRCSLAPPSLWDGKCEF